MTQEVINMISNVGFPIFCCVYMVSNNNKTMQEMTKTISANNLLISELKELITTFINRGDK